MCTSVHILFYLNEKHLWHKNIKLNGNKTTPDVFKHHLYYTIGSNFTQNFIFFIKLNIYKHILSHPLLSLAVIIMYKETHILDNIGVNHKQR